MSSVKLREINLEQSRLTVDLLSKSPESTVCQTDFEVYLKLTGISMVFGFDQWFETESSRVVEEYGMGSFHLPNMTFTMQAQPYVKQEKFRLQINDHKLHLGDYLYKMHTAENSHFQEIFEQFSTVLSEHMRKQVNLDLSDRIAQAI